MLLKMIVVWTAVQLIEGKFISPQIMGKTLKIHPITIIFVILTSGNLFGVVGILLASLVSWLLPGKTVDQVTEVPVPLPPQVKLLTTDDNLMTTLASYSIEGASVDFGSLNINIDSTLLCSDTTLLAINKLSLNAKMLPIDVVVGELPNGLAVDDSIQTISKDHSLLQLLVDRPCRVIAVKNDKGLDIRLSHDTGIDSITGALPASYYFSVVNDIHTQLIQQQKEELISKIPF